MREHETDPGLIASPHVSAGREADRADSAAVQAMIEGRTNAAGPKAIIGLQRLAGNATVNELLSEEAETPSPVREVIGSGGGEPLESSIRGSMEASLGHDFGDVRLHTDAKADESARSVNAQAYTVGSDLVFKSGQYAPETPAGRRTLAHELTHVVQQRSGPVDGTEAPGGIKLSDPSDRFEQAAEQTADRVMTERALPVSADSTSSASGTVQRQAKPGEDEEEVQTLAIQRAAGPDDEVVEDETKAG